MIYDAAVIGAGPAGVSAALNLKLHDQYTKAVGEGNIAAHSIPEYLAEAEKAGGK